MAQSFSFTFFKSSVQLGKGSQDLQAGGGVELMTPNATHTSTSLLFHWCVEMFILHAHVFSVTVKSDSAVSVSPFLCVNMSASLSCGLPAARHHGDETCSQLKCTHCYCLQNHLQSHHHKPDLEQHNQLQLVSITTDIPLPLVTAAGKKNKLIRLCLSLIIIWSGESHNMFAEVNKTQRHTVSLCEQSFLTN